MQQQHNFILHYMKFLLAVCMISLHEGVRTRVRVDYELSEFLVRVWIYHGSVLSPFLAAVVVGALLRIGERMCVK